METQSNLRHKAFIFEPQSLHTQHAVTPVYHTITCIHKQHADNQHTVTQCTALSHIHKHARTHTHSMLTPSILDYHMYTHSTLSPSVLGYHMYTQYAVTQCTRLSHIHTQHTVTQHTGPSHVHTQHAVTQHTRLSHVHTQHAVTQHTRLSHVHTQHTVTQHTGLSHVHTQNNVIQCTGLSHVHTQHNVTQHTGLSHVHTAQSPSVLDYHMYSTFHVVKVAMLFTKCELWLTLASSCSSCFTAISSLMLNEAVSTGGESGSRLTPHVSCCNKYHNGIALQE